MESKFRYSMLLDDLIASDVSFAVYFLPGDTEPTLLLSQSKPLELNSYEELNGRHGFVFAPFTITKKTPLLLLKPYYIYKGFRVDNVEFPKGFSVARNRPQSFYASTSQREYFEGYASFMSMLSIGRFSKLVLSRIHVETNNSQSLGRIFLNTHALYPTALSYLICTPQSGVWMGASPEVLLTGSSKEYHTVSLAGTITANSKTAVWSNKEYEEQGIVTDYIHSVLKSYAKKRIQVSKTETVEAGNVAHLKTSISFNSDAGVGTLVGALHPTPAVCGLPKEEAQDFILKTESHSREYYAGFVGRLAPGGEASLYVNLRCMKVFTNQLMLFAGGGITKQSQSDREWNETADKLRTLQTVIDLEKRNVLK